MISIQTNVTSLISQENLRVNTDFQSQTITRLTSGYRINSSGDDAAGLAVANGYRSSVAELTQGVRNANDGISTLQTVDGAMNNIGKILDRLKTLATESATDTFTGDRNVLNNEFQTLLTEVDRQAQAIGLDSNGSLAKSISVYIGGGQAHGSTTATANSTVTFNLGDAEVDARALGLKGFEALGGTEGTTDIGSGSEYTSVADIIADATNSNSTAVSGYTDFYFTGPGFSDGKEVKVSVNLSGVTDTDSLVKAINSAIAGSTNRTFVNAGIVATVNTDSSGKQQLAFTSSTTAFSVQAGDRLANALMGNYASSNSASGAALATTVTGFSTAALTGTTTTTTFTFTGGGLSEAYEITVASGTDIAAAVTALQTTIASDATLRAAGITLTTAASGSALVFTSSTGEKFNVMVTGDTANLFGMGSFVTGNSGESTYSTVDGNAYSRGTSSSQGAYGTATLEFSLGGASSSTNSIAVDLSAGDATGATVTGTATATYTTGHTFTIALDGGGATTVTLSGTTIAAAAADINATVAGVTASVDSTGHLVITQNAKGAGHSMTIADGTGALADLGLTAGTTYGISRSASSIVDAINAGIAADSELASAGLVASNSGTTITIASSNGTYFRLNAIGSTAAADIGFGTTGVSMTANNVSASSGMSVVLSGGASSSGDLAFSAITYGGESQVITISATDADGDIQSKAITLSNNSTSDNGASVDAAVEAINTALQQSNNATLKQIVAVKDNSSGTEKIAFISALESFSVAVGSTTSGAGVGSQGSSVASTTLDGGATADISTRENAVRAIEALSAAVSKLGSAQAEVGRAQNQLTYAIGLANSQISSLSAAESRLRDADVAAEAANLTKAQVLQQANVAAMAQANTAPQAILSLLK